MASHCNFCNRRFVFGIGQEAGYSWQGLILAIVAFGLGSIFEDVLKKKNEATESTPQQKNGN
jgi:hypothetical protein